jgi:hypothetical protein
VIVLILSATFMPEATACSAAAAIAPSSIGWTRHQRGASTAIFDIDLAKLIEEHGAAT